MVGKEATGASPKTVRDVEQAYEELKRQYDQLVSRNLAGVYRTTIDGRFIDCNDALARILGYPDRHTLMQENTVSIYLSGVEREAFLLALQREGQLINYELTLRHRNGRPVHVLENVFLDEDPQGVQTIQGTLIDITAIKQSEIEQASLTSSYRSLVEHMRDGVLVVKDGHIHYVNPAA